MPDPTEPVVVTEGTPPESPAEAALNHSAPADASATQEELNAKIDESLGLPVTKTETPNANSEPNEPSDSQRPEDGEPTGPVATSTEPDAVEPVAESEPDSGAPKPEPLPAPVEGLTLEVEDAAGKKYQITNVDELPEDFTPKNNRQILQIINDLGKLDAKREEAAKDEEAAAEVAEAKANEQATLSSWDAEIAALQTDNRLEKPKATPGSANFLQDPAVKRVDQVFNYMITENERRKPLGIEPIRSFTDALDKIERNELKEAEAARTKQETETAKAKSGLIGRTSAGGGDTAPVYRAGQARDIWDL